MEYMKSPQRHVKRDTRKILMIQELYRGVITGNVKSKEEVLITEKRSIENSSLTVVMPYRVAAM